MKGRNGRSPRRGAARLRGGSTGWVISRPTIFWKATLGAVYVQIAVLRRIMNGAIVLCVVRKAIECAVRITISAVE